MKTPHTSEINVTTHYTDLIHGDFTKESAKALLLELINYKINFHHLQEFSNEERNNGSAAHSKKRVEELTAEKEALSDFLDAIDGHDKVRINCIVSVQTL